MALLLGLSTLFFACCNTGTTQVKFSATKNTYRYGSSLQYEKADVALDDIYVYNTSCKSKTL